jgi:hypothetical protein
LLAKIRELRTDAEAERDRCHLSPPGT